MVAPAQKPLFSDADCEALRCAAFVDGFAFPLTDARERKLGPKVLALDPYRHNLLFLHHSPFVMGVKTGKWQLLQALWILSPTFKPCSRFRFYLFALRWFFLSTTKVSHALALWIKGGFIDAPGRIVDPNAQPDDDADPRWLAAFVLTAMERLHWTEQAVLHTPYSRLLQYLAEQDDRHPDRKRPRFNRRRDQQAKAYLLAKQARRAAAAAVSQ